MAKQLDFLASGQIIPTALHQEMERSYLEYAMSVIVGRALPDVRDGLKPVHRRILYAMHELGLTPDEQGEKIEEEIYHWLNYNWSLTQWPLHGFSVLKFSGCLMTSSKAWENCDRRST